MFIRRPRIYWFTQQKEMIWFQNLSWGCVLRTTFGTNRISLGSPESSVFDKNQDENCLHGTSSQRAEGKEPKIDTGKREEPVGQVGLFPWWSMRVLPDEDLLSMDAFKNSLTKDGRLGHPFISFSSLCALCLPQGITHPSTLFMLRVWSLDVVVAITIVLSYSVFDLVSWPLPLCLGFS
jgi:hypothetical protein